MRPAHVKLVEGHKYDVQQLHFVYFVDGEGFEYEAECLDWGKGFEYEAECLDWADWFDTGSYSGPQAPQEIEPVFEATSVFPLE
jgi:hypothetical protein